VEVEMAVEILFGDVNGDVLLEVVVEVEVEVGICVLKDMYICVVTVNGVKMQQIN
jgi:hypothetical protein